MDNQRLMQQYNWVNQMVKHHLKTKKKAKKLIDILDEMNLKEDTTNQMVVDKLEMLAKLMFDVDKYSDDVQFVSTIVEDIISFPEHRITKLQIEMCNNLYKQYKEIKAR